MCVCMNLKKNQGHENKTHINMRDAEYQEDMSDCTNQINKAVLLVCLVSVYLFAPWLMTQAQ